MLDTTATYEPAISTGVYSYATHGAVVAVDPETGFIELLDYAVAEDCGTMVNLRPICNPNGREPPMAKFFVQRSGANPDMVPI